MGLGSGGALQCPAEGEGPDGALVPPLSAASHPHTVVIYAFLGGQAR